jgi:hypothetical protein
VAKSSAAKASAAKASAAKASEVTVKTLNNSEQIRRRDRNKVEPGLRAREGFTCSHPLTTITQPQAFRAGPLPLACYRRRYEGAKPKGLAASSHVPDVFHRRPRLLQAASLGPPLAQLRPALGVLCFQPKPQQGGGEGRRRAAQFATESR